MVTKLSHSIHIVLLTAILCCPLAFVSSLQAQSSTDAFYIYQNDGHFDGFFYDEVQSIQYSKLDTLGFEHTDYVSQEIVTADSIYRIMLTAIDSVGFVQPEVKISARVRDFNSSDLARYLSYIEGRQVVFGGPLEELDINVGDILVNYSFDDYEGFSGKVKAIREEDDGRTYVDTDPIEDAHEIYDQFICVEQYKAVEKGQLASRRVAGMPMLGRGVYAPPSLVRQQRRAGEVNLNLLDFSFSSEIPLSDDDGIEITLIPSIEGKVNVKAVWNIPSYIGVTTKVIYDVGVGLEASCGVDFELNPPGSGLVTIPLPAAAPLFQLELLPNLFIRGEGTIKLAVNSPKMKGQLWQKVEIIDYKLHGTCGSGPAPGDATDIKRLEEPNESTSTLQFEGMLQTGLKFPLNLKTNSILSYIFKCGIGATAYVGPKLTANVSIDVAGIKTGDNATYDYFKDSKVTIAPISIDIEASGTYKNSWFGGEKEVTFYKTSFTPFSNVDMYFFPQFSDWKEEKITPSSYNLADGDQEFNALILKPSEWTLFPLQIGIDAYRLDYNEKETFVASKAAKKKFWRGDVAWKTDDIYPLCYNLDGLRETGIYRFYPTFEFMGSKIRASQYYDYQTPGTFLLAPSDTTYFKPEGSTEKVPFKTNGTEVKANIIGGIAGSTCEVGDGEVTVTLPKKNGLIYDYPELGISATLRPDENGSSPYINSGWIHTLCRQPNYHIGHVEIDAVGFRGVNEDLNIDLSRSESARLTWSKKDETNGNTTYETSIDLVFDLSENDKEDRRGRYNLATVKSGTYRQVETSTWEEYGSSGLVQCRSVQTRVMTVTKPFYAYSMGDHEMFASNQTSLGDDYAEGATTALTYKLYKDGVLTEEDSDTFDGGFTLRIFY